jgi:hypothetical protein
LVCNPKSTEGIVWAQSEIFKLERRGLVPVSFRHEQADADGGNLPGSVTQMRFHTPLS